MAKYTYFEETTTRYVTKFELPDDFDVATFMQETSFEDLTKVNGYKELSPRTKTDTWQEDWEEITDEKGNTVYEY